MKTTAEDYLARAPLLRLLAVLALVVAPHFAHMPLWMGAATAAVALWRAAGAVRQWPLPPRWLKLALVVAGFVGVQVSYGRVNGQHAGAALLVLMLALKLTEMRSRRDVLVVVSLCYFTMLTHFLFSQELWTILYLLACAVGVTALLIEANHPGGVLPVRLTLRRSAGLVAQSLPLMLAFFILFPRVPGPLWGLPADAGAARSGISDTMSPGDISQLIESDEVAFRVQFAGPPPSPRDLYWRGPVLSYFDGTRWRAPFRGDDYFRMYAPNARLDAYEDPRAELRGEPVRYEITLQPHRQNWLFALDLPRADALPHGTQLTGYYQLLSRELVKDVARYALVSHPEYRLEPELAAHWQRSASRLPEDRNPRAVALARQWRDEGLSPPALVERALRMFREQEFFYTLEPPRLGADFVDEFLFGTRRGFCEHYASAFTVLMRAAGVPARIVVGYQGGELNAVGAYYVVRQSDAHAWSEVWLEGRGWVRVDPTAAVAPSRIEAGISAALAPSELPGFLRRESSGFWYWRLQADVAWDWVNVMWDRWMIGFNPERQLGLVGRFGLDDWQDMVLALTVLITALMALVGLAVMRQMRAAAPADTALRLWRRATRMLAAQGLPQGAHEGPRDYVRRIVRERPDLAPALERLLAAYLDARYLQRHPERSGQELALAVKALR
jgi:protein-glutamine gamma-glutamyltransferase